MSETRRPRSFWTEFLPNLFRSVVKVALGLLRGSHREMPRTVAVLPSILEANESAVGPIELSEKITRTSFVPCYLADVAGRDEGVHFVKVNDLGSVVVDMPPIVAGRELLSTIDIRENADHMPWHQNSYKAYPAATYMIGDATLHGAVGITGFANYVLAESLWHTTSDRHSYELEAEKVVLLQRGVEHLAGAHVSLLVGAAESYWHSVIDATARLALIPDDIIHNVKSVLLPSTGVAQKELIELYGLPDGVEARLVAPNESFSVELLVYPSSIHYLFDYHPKPLNHFYDRVLSRLGAHDRSGPKLLYIDRRSSGLRRLINENDLVHALEGLGFVAVCLEKLSVREQIFLFRNAEVIVAPHGAGLTNIGFSLPGAWVIELMMDLYLNWCYRRIAAIRSLRYECILGRAEHVPGIHFESIHAQPWSIDVNSVITIVSSACNIL